MNISYQREMKRNYLIVEAEERDEVPFEQNMLEQNQIDGVLHFQVRKKDTDIRFFYEITSKQPLFRLLEGQSVQAGQIRTLVWGIANALDHMEQYLLSENSVLLTPEYLYVEPESLKVWLCLVPGLERDFPEDYSRLLEYLLGKVDHKDKESVVLAYGLYQETRKENYGMEDILRLAQQKLDINRTDRERDAEPLQNFEIRQGEAERRNSGMAENGKEPEQRQTGRDIHTDRAETEWKPGMVRARQIQTDTVKESSGLFGRWKQRRKARKEEKQREQEREMQMPWDLMFVGETQSGYGASAGHLDEDDRTGGMTPFSGGSASSVPFLQQGSGTVLLNPGKDEREIGLRFLRALDAGEPDIRIAYYPFIIGKQENLVDHVLNRETVSRLHLRIDQKEGHYYVQDLNSTNGTMVDGRMLENNETIEIREGTDLSIAGIRYQFR